MKRKKAAICTFLLVVFIVVTFGHDLRSIHADERTAADPNQLSFSLKLGARSKIAEGSVETVGTNVGGLISEDTTWTLKGSPYIVVGGVIVNANVVLTIMPGVVVKFTSGANLVIDGSLIAQGNTTHRITFTSNATAPASRDWRGIWIRSGWWSGLSGWSGLSNITNSIIEYATTGINFENFATLNIFMHSRVTSNTVGIRVAGFPIVMSGLTIENNTDSGIVNDQGSFHIKNSLISKNNIGIEGGGGFFGIENCTISNNTLDGIKTDTTWWGISDSEIVDNGRWGILVDRGLTVSNTDISNNQLGGVCQNGYSSVEIYDSNITNNNGHGVTSGVYTRRGEWRRGGVVIISGSVISNNSRDGVSGPGVYIKSTTIIDNDIGVNTDASKGAEIRFSNLYNNSLYEVKNTGSSDINATHNWWGTTNETLIRERIYDYYDDNYLGAVIYAPFLNSSKATLTVFTSGVSLDEPVAVKWDEMEVGLVHDEKPLNVTVYSGHTRPRMGFSLSIDNIRIWESNPNARYKFVNWTGPAGNGTSDSITLTITADSSITAFYKTQYLTNFTFKDSSGTVTLYVEPSKIQTIAPNGSVIMITSFLNQWLDEGTWTIKQIQWQGNNINPATDPTYTLIAGGTWIINCRVYSINFTDSFKDNGGTDLYVKPPSFRLTFPNDTTSPPLEIGTYLIQNGTTTWHSIIWQGTEVVPTTASTFDATNGNPTINCRVYSLTVDPIFYDNTGTALVQPSSWSIEFPNGTTRTISSPVTYNQTQAGNYLIVSIIWKGTEVVPATMPTTSLTSDMLWSPSINCLLPTSISISLSSSTSYVGFKVEIKGNLTCNEVGLSGAPILLSYSVTGGESWNEITLDNTDSDGGYLAVWMPSATGNYLVRAIWAGNSTYPGTTIIISLAVTPFEEQSVFSVTSNSTVSEFAFNSTSRQLGFTVTGPSGTTGYVNVYIAKTLVDNIADVRVYLDGDQLNYTIISIDDSWLLHFTYPHSTRTIVISLGLAPFIPPQLITPLSLGILAVALAVATVILIFNIRRGAPPTILNGVFKKIKTSLDRYDNRNNSIGIHSFDALNNK